MDCGQDSAFCVPIYNHVDSACIVPRQDQLTVKPQCTSDQQFPVFEPAWKDQAQASPHERQEHPNAVTARSGNSTVSMIQAHEGRVASGAQSLDVSLRLRYAAGPSLYWPEVLMAAIIDGTAFLPVLRVTKRYLLYRVVKQTVARQ